MITAIHEDFRCAYGARRIDVELRKESGWRVSRHRVARLTPVHELRDDHVAGEFANDAPDRI